MNNHRVVSLAIYSLLCVLLLSCKTTEGRSSRPNIIFLMLDTLRADHLSTYGYERQTSPVLDAFAKENLKASFALTAAPWTPASVASMFTGLYPSSHRMMPPNDRDLAKQGLTRLSDQLETLAEKLKSAGYATAGVSPNPWVTKQFGYTQGFDQFFFIERESANKITESGREIIEAWEKNKLKDPFFLYLHFLDPHDPYTPPGEYATKFTGPLKQSPFTYSQEMQDKINLYDGEIAFLDSELGKFFEYLKVKKLYDDLVIVIVSDHGEQFMEHGDERHGYKLFNEEVHIPLFIKTGRQTDQGKVIDETVSTVDILPTILARLGLAKPENLPGVSLMDEAAIKSRRGIMSEIRKKYDMKSVTDNPGNRLIMDVAFDEKNPDPQISLEAWVAPRILGLFESRKEYACMTPLSNKGVEARLRGTFDQIHVTALKTFVAPITKGETIKDETLEQLKSLGYLQ
ncbi:MAG: sulfatase [Pseudomonadota bacterium]